MPTNINPGVALKELGSGHAAKLDLAPVDLGELTGDPSGVVNAAAQLVGPGAIQEPNAQALQRLAPSTAIVNVNGQATGAAQQPVMTMEQAEAILKTIGAGLEVGPTTIVPAPAATPQASTPQASASMSVPGAVDLDRLALEREASTKGTDQPVAPAGQPVAPVATPATQGASQGAQVELSNDAIVQTPLGPMTWGQAKGQMMRRGEFEARNRELLESKRSVDAQQHLIDRVSQSKFGAAYTAVLNAGGSEDEAVQAALAARGIAVAQTAAVVEEPLVPPVEDPANPDPNFQTKWAEYLSKLTARASRDAVQSQIAPLQQRLLQQDLELARSQSAAVEMGHQAQLTLAHNRDLYKAYIEPSIPPGLDQAQLQIVSGYLDEVAKAEGIAIDTSRKMSDNDFRLLAAYAFPGGQLPPQVVTQLVKPNESVTRTGYYSTTPTTPASNGQPMNGQPMNGQPSVNPSLQALPQWQKDALLQQALQTVSMYRTAVGASPTGQMPGIPVNPALQAGPNPSAPSVGAPSGATPAMRPEQMIAARMQSLTRLA
jgi:hypothetical protein